MENKICPVCRKTHNHHLKKCEKCTEYDRNFRLFRKNDPEFMFSQYLAMFMTMKDNPHYMNDANKKHYRKNHKKKLAYQNEYSYNKMKERRSKREH